MKILKYSIVVLLSMVMWGCGKGNPEAPITVDPVTQKAHPDPNWLASTHRKTTASKLPECASCHGGDFKGGIVKVACIRCHPNGPTGVPPHPIGAGYQASNLHGADAKLSLKYCAGCHGTGNNLPFNSITNSVMPSGCASAPSCHFQNSNLAHPTGWPAAKHSGAKDIANSCVICHGADLDGSGGVAPTCLTSVCHSTSPALNPSGCVSCHGNPPNTGKHAKHIALGATCATCHLGGGSGTATHANGVKNVDIDPKYSETGVSYSSPTCIAVSCHGGKTGSGTGLPNIDTAPSWTSTAPLTCLNCHTRVNVTDNTGGQYINVFSGNLLPTTPAGFYAGNNLHEIHMGGGAADLQCTDCHNNVDSSKLQSNHFVNLLATGNTKTFKPGDAAGTVGNLANATTPTKIIKYVYSGPVNGANKSDCTVVPGCHNSSIRSWF